MISFSAGVFLSGLAFGLSLIAAVGPQNVFVIRHGAARTYVTSVVALCTASDVVLITAGVAGVGLLLTSDATVFLVVRFAGAAVLLTYAISACRRALGSSELRDDLPGRRSSRGLVLAGCFAVTWLNPAVYLDTVVLLGAVANAAHRQRWTFAAGAMIASACWFISLGYGARLLAPVLRTAAAWRVLDALVAAIMAVTAARLLAGA